MRKYSQVFLKNKNIAKKIVNLFTELNSGNRTVEIGPGKGILTAFLYNYYRENLTVIDIDPLMIENIKKIIPGIKAINDDFLKLDLDKLNVSYFIGNLPYHISTAIIEKLIRYRDFKLGVFMLQKEVARKLISDESDLEYGYLSAMVNLICKTDYLLDVSKDDFFPVPMVDSAIVLIEKNKIIPEAEFEKYLRFIGYAFRHKRKTLVNSINLSTGIEKEKIIKILEKNSINSNIRTEKLSPEKLFELSKTLNIGFTERR
jgi:16S rRNA (adenine1518-N6/adenine1519-N6)-dimethyltransferase